MGSKDQNRIKHSPELRRYNQRRGLLNRLDCELELTDDPVRLERIRWLMARVRNSGEVFVGCTVNLADEEISCQNDSAKMAVK